MTIRHRITLLVILMLVALSAIGGYAVLQTRTSAVNVRQVTQGVVPSALASADLVSQVKDVQLAMMTLVYAPDANMVSQAQDLLKSKEASLQAALDVQARAAQGQAQTGLVSQARESLANYFSAVNDTAKMKADGKTELAQAYLFANVAQYRDELEGIVETLRIEKNRQKDAAIDELNSALATTTTAIAAATGAAIVVLVLISALLYRQITRPLSRMQVEMSEIAASQDFTRRVPVGRMDEIGHSIVAFNGMIEKIQQSSLQLKQKTADIQAMLQNMQQGILTVVEGVIVHPEYSAYLEAIFETREIAGRPLLDLVFGGTDINSDALAQIEAALQACIGEDSMNFEFNQHLLVNEIAKPMADGRVKTLDLSWSAITDENDVVLRLMLCVRDVTELRALAAEAGEQKRRLEMIGEILAVSQEKFHHFVESATDFISENERIIRQHHEPSHEAVAELFRNMHTVKGNARTYSLQHLTGIVHETEQRYDALRRADSSEAWDQQLLIEDLQRVKAALETYATINEVSLGRKGPGQSGAGEGYLIVDRESIQKQLELLESADPADRDALVSMRESLQRELRLLGTESIYEALAGLLESLPSLAAGTRQGSAGRQHRQQRLPRAQRGQPYAAQCVHASAAQFGRPRYRARRRACCERQGRGGRHRAGSGRRPSRAADHHQRRRPRPRARENSCGRDRTRLDRRRRRAERRSDCRVDLPFRFFDRADRQRDFGPRRRHGCGARFRAARAGSHRIALHRRSSRRGLSPLSDRRVVSRRLGGGQSRRVRRSSAAA
ncbi:two-component system chemotaxis sensor kinase CheA [Paraburkholderia sp. WC7.3d]